MATCIGGLRGIQHKLLVNAFGWESYPNGNSGYTYKAVEWLSDNNHLGRFRGGDAHTPSSARVKKGTYFTYSQVKYLKSLSQR